MTEHPRSLSAIDMTRTSSPEGMRHEGERLDHICREIGFFSVVGHGIDPDLVARMYEVTAAFFHLPADVKARSALDRERNMRGWEPAGQRSLGRSLGVDAPMDLREVFGSSREVPSDDAYYRTAANWQYFFNGTNWPEQPETFRSVWLEYYAAMEDLSERVYRLMEVALGLEAGWFAAYNDRHASPMIANFYPPVAQASEGQLRAGAHTDYGAFTIIHQDDAPGGLQVAGRDGDWIDVAAAPGTFVVNIGDLMARWTNDRWVSTLHRVVLPPAAEQGNPWRVSIPFFQQPNADARIECIPGCEGDDGPRYRPITSGRNWFNKNVRTTGGEPLPEDEFEPSPSA